MQNFDAFEAGITRYGAKDKLLTNGFTLKSWLLTKDHKRIAIMYLITVSLFFLAGGMYAGAIRLELLTRIATCCNRRPTTRCLRSTGSDDLFFPDPVDPGV